MKNGLLALVLLALLTACKNAALPAAKINVPGAPTSAATATAALHDKTFTVTDAGTVDLLNADAFQWSAASTDTTAVYRKYMAERKGLSFRFMNDSLVLVANTKTKVEGRYRLEKDVADNLLMKITYTDSTLSFNPGEVSQITTAFKIRGVDEKRLLLEIPNSTNEAPVVVLLKGE